MDLKLILQIAGVALGLIYLWLEYRADIRLWVVGLIMPVVHGALYFQSGLYADASMQVYYVLAGLYGWLVWRRARRRSGTRLSSHRVETDWTEASRNAKDRTETVRTKRPLPKTPPAEDAAALRIGHTPWRVVPALAAVYAALHAGLYLLLAHCTDSTVPFWDAMTTAASAVAMWMLSRKYVEQWLVWLVVDLITVCLYLYKDIPLTAGLYALYSALAVAGYLRWRRRIGSAA